MRIIEGMVPPNGWHFFEGSTRLEADDFKGIIELILKNRLANGIPAGNPQQDYQNYLCSTAPHMCQGGGPPAPANYAPTPSQALLTRITTWLTNLYENFNGTGTVARSEADQRANICAGCPKNVEWEVGCPTCVSNAKRLGTIIRRGEDVGDYRHLKGCQILGHDNRTACVVQINNIWNTPETNSQLPEFCWAKRWFLIVIRLGMRRFHYLKSVSV